MRGGAVLDAAQAGLKPEIARLLVHWGQLDAIHAAYKVAQGRCEQLTGVPICKQGCGMCCQNAVPLALGAEAEYVSSWAVGEAILPAILDRCRDWLTRGTYIKGNRVGKNAGPKLAAELTEALSERCPFLLDNADCMIHWARPVVCRSYGVTHLPNYWCPRPNGIGESQDARVTFDPMTPDNPIKPMWESFRAGITDARYKRVSFLPLMIFERFRATELAGLIDDGKVPVVKILVPTQGLDLCLWQEDYERAVSYQLAEESIRGEVPMAERDGRLVQIAGARRP